MTADEIAEKEGVPAYTIELGLVGNAVGHTFMD